MREAKHFACPHFLYCAQPSFSIKEIQPSMLIVVSEFAPVRTFRPLLPTLTHAYSLQWCFDYPTSTLACGMMQSVERTAPLSMWTLRTRDEYRNAVTHARTGSGPASSARSWRRIDDAP